MLDCERGQRKHEIAAEYLAHAANAVGLFLVLVDRASAPTWQVEQTQDGRIKNLARRYRYVKHYFFHILDPDWGFSASELAAKVREILHLAETDYRPRHAAYDLRKLRGKHWIQRIGHSRRYRPAAAGLQTISALILIRDQLLKPVLAGAGQPKRGPKPQDLDPIDFLLAQIQGLLRSLLSELGFAF